MRQILWQREVSADRWRYPGEAGAGPVVQTLAELLADSGAAAGDAMVGVRLGPTDEVALLAPLLARVALVVVQFEPSGDGRGYSQGQLLRQRYGIEYRAVAGCIVSRSLVDYVDGYDSVSAAAAKRRFGRDVFRECSADASMHWEHRAAANAHKE